MTLVINGNAFRSDNGNVINANNNYRAVITSADRWPMLYAHNSMDTTFTDEYATIFETTTPFGFTLSFLQGVLFKIANNAILLADVTASVQSWVRANLPVAAARGGFNGRPLVQCPTRLSALNPPLAAALGSEMNCIPATRALWMSWWNSGVYRLYLLLFMHLDTRTFCR